MRICLILCAFLLVAMLAGCGATLPIEPVKVPVPVQCKEAIPERPAMPTEAIQVKPTQDVLLKASLAENERREGYEVKLRTALEACTTPIQP